MLSAMSESTVHTRNFYSVDSNTAGKYSRKPACLENHTQRTWVEIDLAALVRNTRRVISLLPPNGHLIPSIKKDAYGHGIVEVARVLAREKRMGAAGIATMDEAITLRKSGFCGPLICFGTTTSPYLDEITSLDGVTHTITSAAGAKYLDDAAEKAGNIVSMHLKIDTGMGRLGRSGDEVLPELDAIRSFRSVRLTGLWTHLAACGENPGSGMEQVRSIMDFRKKAKLASIPVHLGGSDALSLAERLHPSISIRSGIALFGHHALFDDLEPVMTFKSRVIQLRRVPPGTTVSYDMTFTTKRDSMLALVGAGYGNGYMRSLSSRGHVLIHGCRCPVAGRVCMDQCVIDVTDCPHVDVNDEVVLFGRQDDCLLPVGDVAKWANSISYELMCLAGRLNPRIYLEP